MKVIRLPNGNLLVPLRAESEDGTGGDGMVEVEAGTPEYEEWEPFALRSHPLVGCFTFVLCFVAVFIAYMWIKYSIFF